MSFTKAIGGYLLFNPVTHRAQFAFKREHLPIKQEDDQVIPVPATNTFVTPKSRRPYFFYCYVDQVIPEHLVGIFPTQVAIERLLTQIGEQLGKDGVVRGYCTNLSCPKSRTEPKPRRLYQYVEQDRYGDYHLYREYDDQRSAGGLYKMRVLTFQSRYDD
jgi:hypothetical protein